MKLPQWQPIPKHWHSDADTKDFGASLALIVPVLLIIASICLVFVGLLI
jgi:hypothetical protein